MMAAVPTTGPRSGPTATTCRDQQLKDADGKQGRVQG